MAGFSRAPSAWKFTFAGMNVKDAPDQIPAVQYPIAVNIRALADHSIRTRPGYDLLFTAESAPVITTTCPIDTGFDGEAYEFEFEVLGGIAPYTWTITAGALPDGLTLDSSTGVVSGTPTEFGNFDFTIRVTDSLGHFDEASCSILILPIETCAAIVDDVGWNHNSRIGPFYGQTAGEIFFIGAHPSDPTKLRVLYSDNFGLLGSWTEIDTFASLGNDIISHDCERVGRYVHVPTQEEVGVGRVAYHRFDLVTRTWDIYNQQVVASCSLITGNTSMNGGTVSCTILSTGAIGIMYDTDKENVTGTDYYRTGYRESTDSGTTWSTEYAVSPAGGAVNYCAGRCVADNVGRVQFFMGNTDSPGFGHYYDRTLRANKTLSTIATWATGGGLSQIQQGRMTGDYATYESGGITKIVWCGRQLEDGKYAIFTSVDDIGNPDVVGITTLGSTFLATAFNAYFPQNTMRMVGTTLYGMGSSFSNSVPTHNFVKIGVSPYGSGDWTPTNTGNAYQSGPEFDTFTPGQCQASTILNIGGTHFYLSVRDSDVGGYGLVYNWIRVDQLPSTESITVWAADCSA